MVIEEFISLFKHALHIQGNIDLQTPLIEIPEWDSLGLIVTIAFLNKEYGVKILSSEIQLCLTVEDIFRKAGI